MRENCMSGLMRGTVGSNARTVPTLLRNQFFDRMGGRAAISKRERDTRRFGQAKASKRVARFRHMSFCVLCGKNAFLT